MASIGRPQRRVDFLSRDGARQREANFESYWLYQQRRDGAILEDAKDLAEKQKTALCASSSTPCGPGARSPRTFHRNYDTHARRSAEPRPAQRCC
jgi:hypothetical protein